MNPVRAFLAIFSVGLLLTIGLGIYGMVQYEWGADEAGNDVNDEAEAAHDPFADAPAALDSCIACHGSDLEGTGAAPALVGVEMEYNADEIVDIILNGIGAMPEQPLSEGEAEEVAEYLLAFEMPENGDDHANETENANSAEDANEDIDV